jgi:hypothetical protein
MAQPTAYPCGALITSTTTETGFTIRGSYKASEPITVALTLVSGSVQLGVTDQDPVNTPIINQGGVTHTTWSTAGDKILMTFSPVAEEIRMTGTATFALNW